MSSLPDRMTRTAYEREKRSLQVELLKLQADIRRSADRLLVLVEGRAGAGRGGAIRAFTEHLNPRGARTVALDKPTDQERTQWYFQRHVAHLPSGGEIVFMNRSWYNRAGVEPVMGYCSASEHEEFLQTAPEFEHMLVGCGIRMVKLWFAIDEAEQTRRFDRRAGDALGQWKLSGTRIAGADRWQDFVRAEETMFARTHTSFAPWTVIAAEDKRRARLEAIRVVLARFDYPGKDPLVAHAPDPQLVTPPPRTADREDAPV
ncbi:polyphosphate kinase 2 [Microbacterium algeriense]|uniref:polyphosphate kinase 2 n=1 Tax=Microbacterium algeriense TaxID=2615184 RepID=UPI0029BA423E|nr:polyphosphate kinase 2 [Microbacterium algeriense]MDX2399553.1 polyphosphate kinase 2 [Microbacterium algeriense]